MCNRYRPSRIDKLNKAEEFKERYGLTLSWTDIDDEGNVTVDGFKGEGDVYPLYQAPVLRQLDDTTLLLEYRSWGLLPPTFKPLTGEIREAKAQQRKTVNARCETLEKKWPWKLVYKQRCVLPAANFYEPHSAGGHARYEVPGSDVIYIAGLWSDWSSKTTEASHRTYTMITTRAGEVVASTRGGQRRDRQPVVFTALDQVVGYLNPETEHGKILPMLVDAGDRVGLSCVRDRDPS